MIFRILLDPQGGEGTGAGEPASTPKPAESNDGARGADTLVKAVENLVAKHGDSSAAMRVLLGENYEYRDKNRELKAKLPPEGSIILTGDDAKRWGTYRELGEPSELRKGLGERDQYKAEADGFRKVEHHRAVAEVSGYKPQVLGTLIDRDKLDIEITEEKGQDGKVVRVAVVKGDGESKPVKLADYAAEKWQDFLPSLAVVEQVQKPNGTPVISRPRITPASGQGPEQRERRRPISSF